MTSPTAYPACAPASYSPFAAGPVRLAPSAGLIPTVLGAALSAAGLFGISWKDGVSYTDLFKANKDLPQPSGSNAAFVHNFLSGGAYGVALIGAVLAALWCFGVIGRRLTRPYKMAGVPAPRLARTRVTISCFQALFLATQSDGVWKLFDGHFDGVQAGPLLLVAGAACLFVAALIGPTVKRAEPRSY
jgi:hypothetical protein